MKYRRLPTKLIKLIFHNQTMRTGMNKYKMTLRTYIGQVYIHYKLIMRFKLFVTLLIAFLSTFFGEIKAEENICKYSNYNEFKKCKRK